MAWSAGTKRTTRLSRGKERASRGLPQRLDGTEGDDGLRLPPPQRRGWPGLAREPWGKPPSVTAVASAVEPEAVIRYDDAYVRRRARIVVSAGPGHSFSRVGGGQLGMRFEVEDGRQPAGTACPEFPAVCRHSLPGISGRLPAGCRHSPPGISRCLPAACRQTATRTFRQAVGRLPE